MAQFAGRGEKTVELRSMDSRGRLSPQGHCHTKALPKRLFRGEFAESRVHFGEEGYPETDLVLILFNDRLQKSCKVGQFFWILFCGYVLTKLAH